MEKHYIENIKYLRKLKRISQEDMAKGLGFAQSNYNKIEKGTAELTVDRLYQIADVLGVSVFQILVDTNEQTALEVIRKEVEENFNKELFDTKLEEFKEEFKTDFEKKFAEGLSDWFKDVGSQLSHAIKNPPPETTEKKAEKEKQKEEISKKRVEKYEK
jgi:transcriptional regulator with XRE-family HTH domain